MSALSFHEPRKRDLMRVIRALVCGTGLGLVLASGLLAQVVDALPSDAQFVASSRGRVYYWVECITWRSLAPANVRFFASREEAERAGYTPSQSDGCAGPASGVAVSGGVQRPPDRPGPRIRYFLAPGSRMACEVSRVVDGDTIECAGLGPVRLLLIDAPEMDQEPLGAVARYALEGLLPPGTITELEIDVDPNDQYGRTLAYVHLPDGRVVNEELLRSGVAVVTVYPPNIKYVDRFRAVLEEARTAQRGLWALDAFSCLPADHRAGQC